MNDWNDPVQREAAFKQAITNAMRDQDIKDALLDPDTAKETLEGEGDITLPRDMTVVFYRQEDLDMRLVSLIPAPNPEELHLPRKEPGFRSCFLCTWITYRKMLDLQEELDQIARDLDLRKL